MREMLYFISSCGLQERNVIVFGEIYGNKVMPMDYGCPKGKGYRVFDISVNGEYIDWHDVKCYCVMFDIGMAPLLYEGPFSQNLLRSMLLALQIWPSLGRSSAVSRGVRESSLLRLLRTILRHCKVG